MRRRILLVILLVTVMAFAVWSFIACADTAEQTKPSVVSVEKTDSGELTDTYTMTFSDGSTYKFTVDREGGTASDSAYELYVKHTGYTGSEQQWLAALLDGTLFDKPNGRKVLTLTVTDETDNAIADATVKYAGYTFMTSSDGKCEIVLSAAGDITVTKIGYVPGKLSISSTDIETDGDITRALKLAPVMSSGEYKPRGDNYIEFSIPAGDTVSTYYWYAEYDDSGIRVSVDVLDTDIVSDVSNLGMNDNIEFIIQRNTASVGLDEQNSFNVLATIGFDGKWARFAGSADGYDADISAELIDAGLLEITRSRNIALLGGVNYVSIEIFMDYRLWDVSYDEAVGDFTISPAARNGVKNGYTAFRSYVGYDCVWSNASTNVRIKSDGSFTENYFDLPDLEKEIKRLPDYVDGRTLENDMAELSSKSAVARRYVSGELIFTDRTYFVEKTGIPAALDGVSFLYGSIETVDFAVERDGYVVVAIPNTSARPAAYLSECGFSHIAEKLPAIAHSTNGSFLTDRMDYYVKYAAKGEEYVLPKWGVVFFSEHDEYGKNNWETVPATVTALSTDALVAEYAPSARKWQGIPGIECVRKSDGSTRLFACWFTGMDKEPRVGNYAVVYYSDDGDKWNPAFAVDLKGTDAAVDSRVFDPSLFVDDDNNLWIWWNQTNEPFAHVTSWYCKVGNAADGNVQSFTIGAPVMTSYGLKMNKPIKLSTGEWLYCAHDFTDMGKTKVYSSKDKGATWKLKGIANVPNARFANETAIAEHVDNNGDIALVMWNRCTYSYNIAVSYSYDLGKTWTDSEEFYNYGPSSRMNAKTLAGGNILYVHHYRTESRTNLCAFLSEDGGKTFPHALVLDTRRDVSYPDIATDDNGNIYIVWDYNRYIDKQILMTTVTERELLAIDGMRILDADRIKTVSSLTLGNECADVHISVVNGGSPVDGASVTLSAPYRADITAVTDEYGVAVFGSIPAEEYVVTVSKQGYYDGVIGLTERDFIDALFDTVSSSIELASVEYVTLRGNVTDMFTGAAISGAIVSVGGLTAVTDDSGAYTIAVPSAATTVSVAAKGYHAEERAVSLAADIGKDHNLNVSLYDSTYTYIGKVGGKVSDVDTLMWSVYLSRNADGLSLVAAADDMIPSDGGLTQFEIWFHAGAAGTTRTANTGNVDYLSSGLTRAAHFPSNKSTSVFSLKDNTSGGITFTMDNNVITSVINYETLSKIVGGYAVDESTPLAVNLLGGRKVGNAWSYAEWRKENSTCYSGTGVISRFDPSTFVLFKPDGSVSVRAREGDSTDDLDALVRSSSIGNENKKLSENMARFELSPTMKLHTVKTGNYTFDDRTTHCFNGKQLRAVDGMSFVYDGVSKSGSVSITQAGYLLMYAPGNAAVSADWTKIVSKTENPGYAIGGDVALYAAWVDVGDKIDVVGDGLLMTNAIKTDILVFGDSYTDAHDKKFWKNWNETMAPHGAETIGISGSRIATETAGDPFGWTARASAGEIAAYNPEKILINLGVNDIDNGISGRESAVQLIVLLEILREQLPDADIYYTLIVDNIMFAARANNYAIHNERVKSYIESDTSGKLHVIDFRDSLYYNANGIKTLDSALFADNLHLSVAGYKIWFVEIEKVMGLS